MSEVDKQFMQQACDLALQGEGRVEPNPMVGCVLVRDNQVIGAGYHQRFGGPHAEREALASLPSGAAHGATAYVTLEPCCHHGKTPPCTDALIEAGIARVCCALRDPYPEVSGRGIQLLQAAGIAVDVLAPEDSMATEILAPYLKRVTRQLPFVIAKWAMSLDGKMATRTGDSRWISGQSSRAHAHSTRGRVDAIIVGSRTAKLDDPLLTARPPGPRQPLRVVVDSGAALSMDSNLVKTAQQTPVLVWTSFEAPEERVEALKAAGCQVAFFTSHEDRLLELLQLLGSEHKATNVLVEGGGRLLGELFDRELIDEYQVYMAPKIIGGDQAVSPLSGWGLEQVAHGPELKVLEQRFLGTDVFIRARRV